MTAAFAVFAGLAVGAAVAAMALRNLVHCVLCLTASLVGVALLYLQLGAEFAGFVQVLVYVGAVAILVVFAMLLTRGGEPPAGRIANAPWSGVAVAAAVFGTLARAIHHSPAVHPPAHATVQPTLTVGELGGRLLSDHVLPLQATALLLTAALLGAVVVALRTRPRATPPPGRPARPATPDPDSP